jgi:hypothetical protein
MAKGDTVDNAEVGDSVRFKTPQGAILSGAVRMRFQNHVVVLQKGQGIPNVVDEKNFVSLRRSPNRKEMVRWL